MNRLLQESEVAGVVEQDSAEEASNDEWDGFPDQPDLEIVDHEEEYIDEDRYTTVTVESVSVTRDGLHKPQVDDPEGKGSDKEDNAEEDTAAAEKANAQSDKSKKKKKKFRYETKFERQLTERKQRAKKSRRPA